MDPRPMPPVLFDGFVLTAKVGGDRVGSCYLAVPPPGHALAGTQVVLRLLHDHLAEDPRHVEEFVAQARRAVQVGDRNQVEVFGIGEVNGQPYWVLEREAALRRLRVAPPVPAHVPIAEWWTDDQENGIP
jgi:hypothetical protein